MTKMLTTVAALQQKEMGNARLRRARRRLRPEFADLQVLEGFDGDTPRLRLPASQATVEQLVTHTAGLSYWFWNADIMRWEAVTGTPNVLAGVNAIFTAPLVADPGTKFEYGINADWLGRVIEAASGVTLDVAVKEGITGPLGMDETTLPAQLEPGREHHAAPPQGRGRQLGDQRDQPGRGAGVLVRRARPVLHPARLHQVPAGAAAVAAS